MTTMQWILLALWVLTTAMNYAVVRRESKRGDFPPRIERAALLMVSAMPLMTLVVIWHVCAKWFARHWEIVKIERSLRER